MVPIKTLIYKAGILQLCESEPLQIHARCHLRL